jgi:hypothetical protein
LVGERADYIPWFRLSFLQPTGFAERVGPPVIRSIGIFERDLQFYLDVFDTNLVLARVGPPETLKLCAINTNLIGLARTNRFRLSSMLLQGLPRLPQKDAVAYAYSRFAQTALAIERFRSTYGRVPEHLSELVPEFLPSVLIDPFDGQPLRFHALPKGYVIYSIDADGQDNGGKEHPHHIQNMVTNSVRFRNVVAYPGVPATNNQPFGPLPASSTFTNSPTAEFREVPTSTNPPPYDLTFIVER